MSSFSQRWNAYWFAPAACFDLAIMRIIACAVTLFFAFVYHDNFSTVARLAEYPPEMYQPIVIFKLIHAPFGWGVGPEGSWIVRPDGQLMHWVAVACLASGVLALVGFFTRVSLFVFACAFTYVQAYLFSFGDMHHPEGVMVVALFALALAPSGRVLSVDAALRGQRVVDIDLNDEFAGWPVKLIQWFFVLMYWSAVVSKFKNGGLDWANGYTLQYYLARNGIRYGSDVAVLLSQHHWLVLLGQIGVLAFQAVFFLCLLFPILRWVFVPGGLFLHSFIYVTLRAPFFTWIGLYCVFIPWAEIAKRFRGPRYVVANQGR